VLSQARMSKRKEGLRGVLSLVCRRGKMCCQASLYVEEERCVEEVRNYSKLFDGVLGNSYMALRLRVQHVVEALEEMLPKPRKGSEEAQRPLRGEGAHFLGWDMHVGMIYLDYFKYYVFFKLCFVFIS
jgi:hypothetical protein